ncbi:MAG: DUF58 domain-containing protein [Phycisphaerae bacterium]
MSKSKKYYHPDVLSKISSLQLRARHVVEGFVSGMHKSPYKGFSVEFANHRAYVPGDDIRHIDWRVYAKADRFFIKEYEEETNMRVNLVVDGSGSMAYPAHPGTDRMTKWDYAATLATSLAHLLVLQQDAVGLTLFDQGIEVRTPVSSNRAALHGLAATLEDHAPADRTDVKAVFEQLAAAVSQRGLVVILSDLLAGTDDVVAGLERLRYTGQDVIVWHIMDHDELEFPFTDRTLFEGLEQVDQEVLTDPQALRTSYLSNLRAFLDQIEGACLNNRIDYMLLDTAQPVDIALATFLARRLHQQRARA